jgi:hypothetical protein
MTGPAAVRPRRGVDQQQSRTEQPGSQAVFVYFRRVEDRTELRLEMDYRVAGGTIGRLFDARVGDEMVATEPHQ